MMIFLPQFRKEGVYESRGYSPAGQNVSQKTDRHLAHFRRNAHLLQHVRAWLFAVDRMGKDDDHSWLCCRCDSGSLGAMALVETSMASPITESKRIAILMIAPLFAFVLGRFSVIIAVPMILAWFLGVQVEYTYTIDSYELSCYKGCRWVLTLKGLPVNFDRILPSKRDKRVFQTDKHIIVTGRGTSWGVYAENFRQVD